jgi:PAT family beta-lactamase induction signal transducer AmpG
MADDDGIPAASPPLWRAASWVPSLYFVEGLPYVVANHVSVALYKTLKVGNAEIAFLTSWLSLVWALKALWSPFVDGVSTKRRWTVAMQAAMVPTLVLIAAALPTPWFLQASIALFFVMAFASATHDIAADGLYMLGLPEDQQAALVGLRSTFWRLALISGEGGLVMLAGLLGAQLGPVQGWGATLGVAAAVFALGAAYHAVVLPHAPDDRPRAEPAPRAGAEAVRTFFAKEGMAVGLLFILFFRFGENHMAKLITPFLLDPRVDGGMGLSLAEVGFAKGTVGVAALVVGGILGGVAIWRHGLKAWMWPMVVALNAPDLVYVYLAWAQPESYSLVCGLLGLEAFGYGFGFTAYMMFLIHLAEGEYKTTHYAFATGLMALAVWAAQVWSGAAQEALGYLGFFCWVLVLTIPSAVVAWLVDVPAEFGRAPRSSS